MTTRMGTDGVRELNKWIMGSSIVIVNCSGLGVWGAQRPQRGCRGAAPPRGGPGGKAPVGSGASPAARSAGGARGGVAPSSVEEVTRRVAERGGPAVATMPALAGSGAEEAPACAGTSSCCCQRYIGSRAESESMRASEAQRHARSAASSAEKQETYASGS